MPTYTFRNTLTGEIFDKFMRMAEREPYLKDNPHLEQTITQAPGLGDPLRLGRIKAPSDYNDLLKGIKKKHKDSTIQTW